jgi:hypothetical protein
LVNKGWVWKKKKKRTRGGIIRIGTQGRNVNRKELEKRPQNRRIERQRRGGRS